MSKKSLCRIESLQFLFPGIFGTHYISALILFGLLLWKVQAWKQWRDQSSGLSHLRFEQTERSSHEIQLSEVGSNLFTNEIWRRSCKVDFWFQRSCWSLHEVLFFMNQNYDSESLLFCTQGFGTEDLHIAPSIFAFIFFKHFFYSFYLRSPQSYDGLSYGDFYLNFDCQNYFVLLSNQKRNFLKLMIRFPIPFILCEFEVGYYCSYFIWTAFNDFLSSFPRYFLCWLSSSRSAFQEQCCKGLGPFVIPFKVWFRQLFLGFFRSGSH